MRLGQLLIEIWFYFAFPIESRSPEKVHTQLDNCCLKWPKTNWLLLNFSCFQQREIKSVWCPAHTHEPAEPTSNMLWGFGHSERLTWFECARISLCNHMLHTWRRFFLSLSRALSLKARGRVFDEKAPLWCRLHMGDIFNNDWQYRSNANALAATGKNASITTK